MDAATATALFEHQLFTVRNSDAQQGDLNALSVLTTQGWKIVGGPMYATPVGHAIVLLQRAKR